MLEVREERSESLPETSGMGALAACEAPLGLAMALRSVSSRRGDEEGENQ